jgi:hypothetical protein
MFLKLTLGLQACPDDILLSSGNYYFLSLICFCAGWEVEKRDTWL